ncbi:LEA type 2 family protein [Methanocaldococcus sp.]
MDLKKFLILFIPMVVIVGLSGCLEPPKVEVIEYKIQSVNMNNTKFTIKVLVDNPYPIGVTINKISLDIYALVDGDKIHLGHGEQDNIKISSGNSTFELPIIISNEKIAEAVLKSKSTKLPVEIKGNISINLIVTTVNIPIDIKREIDVSGVISQSIKNEIASSLNNIQQMKQTD